MAIQVTCPGCFARFSVSDRFAGREGPCPKCKAQIRIPDKSEEVVIYAPESAGPKDREGRPVLRPLKRRENSLSAVSITLIAAVILGCLAVSISLRFLYDDPNQVPAWLLALGAVGLAVPVVMAGYAILRDPELGAFTGQEYLLRTLICSAVFALTWLAFPLAWYTFGSTWDASSWILGMVIMVLVGSIAAMLCWEFDLIPGIVHYGFFLGCSLLLRLIAGVGVLPGMVAPPQETVSWISILWPLFSPALAA